MLKQKRPAFWFMLFMSTGLFACLLPFFNHQLNPDAVAYIAIAEKYAAGNFSGAFSSYWSPLISWLLAPMILIGMEPVTAFKSINHVAAVFIASKAGIIFPAHRTNNLVHYILIQTVYIVAIMHGLCSSTPDIISAALVIQLFLLLQQFLSTSTRRYLPLLTGVISAAAFYAKHYHLAGSSMLFLLTLAFLLKQKENKTRIKALAKAYAIFILLCLPWAFLNLLYTHTFTFSSAGTFNLSMLQQPNMPHPGQEGKHLLHLPYQTFSYASIENPLSYPLNHWTPTDDFRGFTSYLLFHIPRNIWHTIQFFFHLLILLLAGWMLMRFHRIQSNTSYLFPLLATWVYPLFYILIVSEYRYLIFCETIAIAIIFQQMRSLEKIVYPAIVGVLLSSLSLYKIIQYPDKGELIFETAGKVSAAENLKNKSFISSPSLWNKSVSLAYFTRSRYHDSLKPELLKENADTLKQRQILYYFCTQKELSAVVIDYEVVAENNNFVFIKWH